MGEVVPFPVDIARPSIWLSAPDPMNFPPEYPDWETEEAMLWFRLFTYGMIQLARQQSIDAAVRLRRRGLVVTTTFEQNYGQGPKEYLLVRRAHTTAAGQGSPRA